MIGERIVDLALYREVENKLDALDEQTELLAPVYVLSRHRAGKTSTTKLLDDSGVDYQVVVEPHDFESYAAHFPAEKLLTLPKDNQGIAYVRNFILAHALENGFLYAWQLDDDVSYFVYRKKGERIYTNPRPLMSILEQVVFRHDNVAGASIPSQAFIFGYDNKPPLNYNAMLYQVKLLRTDTGIWFEDGIPDDVHRSLQLLEKNWSTIVAVRFGQDSPQPTKQTGGLTETEYREGGRMKKFETLVDTWPDRYRIGFMKDGTPKLIARRPFAKYKQLPKPIHVPRYKV